MVVGTAAMKASHRALKRAREVNVRLAMVKAGLTN